MSSRPFTGLGRFNTLTWIQLMLPLYGQTNKGTARVIKIKKTYVTNNSGGK